MRNASSSRTINKPVMLPEKAQFTAKKWPRTQRKWLPRVFCSVLIGTVSTQSMAQVSYSLEEVVAAYEARRYTEAAPGLEALAAAGNMTAKALWCEANAMGYGVSTVEAPIPACYEAANAGVPRALGVVALSLLKKSDSAQKLKGAVLAERAANAGDARGMLLAGQAYYFGEIARDPVKAVRYLNQSMALGEPLAELYLGDMYTRGDGVPQDVPRGLNLLNDAAGKGNNAAKRTLGSLYVRGELVPKDFDKAAKYFTQASQAGDVSASFSLYQLYASASNSAQLRPWADNALQQAVAGSYGPAEAEHGVRLLNAAKTQDERDKAKQFLRAANAKGIPEGSLNYAIALLGDAQPDYQQARPILDNLIRTLPDTDIGLQAGIAMAWMIAHQHAKGTSNEVNYLLDQAERSSNPSVTRMAITTREQIIQDQRAQDAQSDANTNPAAGLFAGLLLLGLLSSASTPASSSEGATPQFEDNDDSSRRAQCILENHLCVEDCTYASTEAASQCRMSCPNTCL